MLSGCSKEEIVEFDIEQYIKRMEFYEDHLQSVFSNENIKNVRFVLANEFFIKCMMNTDYCYLAYNTLVQYIDILKPKVNKSVIMEIRDRLLISSLTVDIAYDLAIKYDVDIDHNILYKLVVLQILSGDVGYIREFINIYPKYIFDLPEFKKVFGEQITTGTNYHKIISVIKQLKSEGYVRNIL